MKLKDTIPGSIRFCTLILLYFLFIDYETKLGLADFMIQEGFFRFVIPLVLTYGFLYKFYKFMALGEKFDFWLLFWGFACVTSSEISAGICLTVSFCSFVYSPSIFFRIRICGCEELR